MKDAALRHAIASLLAKHLGIPAEAVGTASGDRDDLVLSWGPHRFLIEAKSSGTASATAMAIERLHAAEHRGEGAIPLVVVPFMGAVGASRCRAAGISWLDLSGNADITGPGLRIHVEGRPSRFKHRGRPSNTFAPKSSRVARRLLIEPWKGFRQHELADLCGLDPGYVSKIVRRLEQDNLVARDHGVVRVTDPDLLLDAWQEQYDFNRHLILAGHMPSRSSDELAEKLSNEMNERRLEHALTGLAAAWRIDAFAEFRLVTLYVSRLPEESFLEQLGFREGARGSNVWLVVPNDEGVLQGAAPYSGTPCVHPVQVYLDLAAHPERANDAAKHIRNAKLTWKEPDGRQ